MTKSLLFVLTLLTTIATTATTMTVNNVSAEKCEDITGTEKWDPEGHGDNNPSEKKFKKMLNDDSVGICELAEAIDHMEVTGSVKDWSDFEETTVYMGTSEEVQECLEDRHDLPDDDGDKHLADYEIQKCATGDY